MPTSSARRPLAQTDLDPDLDAFDAGAESMAPVPIVRAIKGKVLAGTRYKIVRWLGEGSAGVVYEAENFELGRRVAIKVLRPEHRLRPELIEMFRSEARALGKLDCPYVIQPIDLVPLPDGRLALPMQLVLGPSLEMLVADGALEVERVIPILRQLCKGLGAAHAADIVHGDVKPSNAVVVQSGGREGAVRILDFGLSTAISNGTSRGSSRGSPYYMSPEQADGGPIDLRADLYGLGCTAYELLSGHPPFNGETVEALLDQHRFDPPPALPDCVPTALAAAVMRCLAKQPDDRFPDTIEFEAAICEAQIEAKIRTRWDDLPLPDVDEVRRADLRARMPGGSPPGRTATRLMAVLGGSALLLSVAVAWGMRTDPPTATDLAQIAAIATDAREAADGGLYVYPPHRDPTAGTAYRKVRELERLHGTAEVAAEDAAAELRGEFATELIVLGDRYWGEAGGRAFAGDYYAQALVFDPTLDRAQSRSALTLGQLNLLGRKAGAGDFSLPELMAAQPLLALAVPEAERDEKIAVLLNAPHQRSAMTEANLRLLKRSAVIDDVPTRVPVEVTPVEVAPVEVAPVEVAVPDTDPVVEPDLSEEPVGVVASDKGGQATSSQKEALLVDSAAARSLAREGAAAMARGDIATARRKLEAALALDPNQGPALATLSDIHFDAGRFSKARKYASRAISVAPRNAKHHMRLGDAYYQLVRFREAQAQYERAAELGDARAARRLARVQGRL
ncbi:MAG: protein kinase [Nannocystaceae bacterium]|nr:protein kinase [Nannocystaceae bacterium]